ncbi:MAG: cellulase family glycosylhydrolase [Acidimicrobiales bacterium]
MPSRVAAAATAALAGARTAAGRAVTLEPRARWSVEQASAWGDRVGWLLGSNFTPSTAGNQLELWQAATFDPATIDRELGWAAEVVGMNSIRLFLHDLAWLVDPTGFLDRLDRVLDLAAGHGISTMPVLFDGIWDPDPRPGPQRLPRPGIHNSTWVQGPGAAVLADRTRWPSLRDYVDAVVGRFGGDERVVAWDLFNEPDSPNPAWAHRDPARKRELVADLVEQVWDWAVDVGPDQPLTVGVYESPHRHPERASRVARTALERSDVISFHSYAAADGLRQAIQGLRAHGRPLVCTEWMGRPTSPVQLAEVLQAEGVGAYVWGLVDGRTQTRHSWTSWIRRDRPDRGWFHELLHPDGTPYDEAEAALLRRLSPRPSPDA